MCGIVGLISEKDDPNSVNVGIQALKRLEYRGYDSAGLAYWDREAQAIVSCKSVGRIRDLEKKLGSTYSRSANPIILHTRWATHGNVSEKNAHPHHDCHQNIWVVHNGIIENYLSLRKQLESEGHKFVSDTDTEVIAHLIEKYFKGNLEDAVRDAIGLLEGTYGLAVISREDPQKIVAARLASPLLIGVGDGVNIVASDPSAIVSHTRNVIYLEDREIAVIHPQRLSIITDRRPEAIEWCEGEVEKGDYPHFMLKEIMEQPARLQDTLRGRLLLEEGSSKLGGLDSVADRLREIQRIYIVACGTARHAGLIGEYLIEELAGILTKTEAGSEFRYRTPILDKDTAVIAISQSGETADTLAAIREARARGVLTLGITNVPGSTQARETDAGVYCHAGPEIAVASTKAFTSQVLVLSLLAVLLGRNRKLSLTEGQRVVEEMAKIPDMVQQVLDGADRIRDLADKYKDCENYLYLGRKYNYPIAREGAHKIKETAYVHAEGCRGGEPKHCELALVQENFPSVCLAPRDSVYEKMISNIQEIKARNGPVIAVATEGDQHIGELADDVIYIPKTLEILTPIVSIVPLQLFAYYVSVLRGFDIDKPRNLAKSVTVE